MTRIEEEKKTVRQMVERYCKGHHHASPPLRGSAFCPTAKAPTGEGVGRGLRRPLCQECSALLDYAIARLDHCKFGDKKPTCKKCPIHCYKPAMREQMKEAMRYAGPRMLWHHPVSAIIHLIRDRLRDE